MNTQPTELKSAFDVMKEVENAILEIDELPRLLQLLIDNYHLDKKELTESEMYDLGIAGHTIYSVLYIVQKSKKAPLIWQDQQRQDEKDLQEHYSTEREVKQ